MIHRTIHTLDRLPDAVSGVARLLVHTTLQIPAHPGRAALAGAALIGAITALRAAHLLAQRTLEAWRHARLAADGYLVTITPPPEVDPTGAGALWAHLHGLSRRGWRRAIFGNPHLVWEYAFTARAATIRVWVPGTIPPGLIPHAVAAAWPGATTTTSRHPDPPLPAGVPATGGSLRPERDSAYPLATDHDTDPLRPLLDAGAATRADEHAVVQIVARPASPRRARQLRHAPTDRSAGTGSSRHARHRLLGATATLLDGGLRAVASIISVGHHHTHHSHPGAAPGRTEDAWRTHDVAQMVTKLGGPLWEAHLRYGLTIDPNGRPADTVAPRLRGRGHMLATSFSVFASPTNALRRHRAGRGLRALINTRAFGARGCLLSVAELAALAHLPHDLAVPGLDRAGARPIPAPAVVPSGGRATKPLGTAQIGGHAIALSVPDSRYHLHIPGKTGTGKSTAIAHLALADIKAGRGTVVIDPGGDLITDILDRLPLSAVGRVVLLDPDTGHPPRVNPLAGPDPELAVDQLVGMFATIFARHWGPRADDVLRSVCLTVLRATHGTPTLELLVPMLTSKQTRAPIVANLNDSAGLGGFWAWYDELAPGVRTQVVGPVLARLRQFLLRDFVRACVGDARSDSGPPLDMTHILDHGGILLCRLPKGTLGDDTARLLGSFVVAQVWQATTARVNTPEADRRDAAIYIDECHNFLTLPGSVDDMLAEARKYRLSMTLAHQNLTQLPRELRDALAANARNKLIFNVSPDDARQLARHTLPELSEHDLSHLDAYTAAARLVINARETRAFTLHTRPAAPILGQADALRAAWIERAGRSSPGSQAPTTQRPD